MGCAYKQKEKKSANYAMFLNNNLGNFIFKNYIY